MLSILRIFQIFISVAFAQGLPEQFTVEGRLHSGGLAVSGPATLRLEVIDSAKPACVLYREKHSINLTSTTGSNGFYAVALGAGTDVISGGNSLSTIFANGIEQKGDSNADNSIDATDLSTCKFTPSSAAQRLVRLAFSLDGGISFTALSPDTAITTAPTAMVANSLQGKSAAAFLQVNQDSGVLLTQSNLDSLFNSTNFARLQQLLSPTASLGFAGQRLSNLSDPSSAQDAATKNYADGNLAGYGINLNGVAPGANGGMVLAWDQAAGKWSAQNFSMTDSTKLPLAGGQMSGQLDMNGNVIWNTGHIVLGQGKVISLGTVKAPLTDAALGLGSTHDGATWYNRDDKFLTVWDGSRAVKQAYLDAGGKLDGAWIPALAAASIGTSELASGAVITSKLMNGTLHKDRILMTDGIDGSTVVAKDCANDEVLKFVTGAGWSCASVGTLSPVVSVAGKTGAVTLNANDVSGLGTAALYAVGVGASEIPLLSASGKLAASVIPVFGGDITGTVTSTVVSQLKGYPISGSAPSVNDALRWDGSSWKPTAITDNGITALTGDVAASGNGSVAATIQSGAITNAKLAVNAVASANIQDGAVGSSKVAALAIGSTQVQDYSLPLTKWASPGAAFTNSLPRWDGLSWGPTAMLSVMPDGKVGIGTTNPSYELDVNGSARASLFLGGTITTQYSNTASLYSSTAMPAAPAGSSVLNSGGVDGAFAAYRFSVRNSSGNTQKAFFAAVSETGASAYSPNLIFGQYTDSAATASAERMRISSQGNVGIGISPAARLHIKGDVVQEVSAASGMTVDFSTSNLQYMTASCGAINISGIKNGGTYVLAVQGGGASPCSFSVPGGMTLKTGTIVMAPASGKHIVFTFMVMGAFVYVASADNY